MPDDFDFSQPRIRRSSTNVDFPLLTTLLVVFCVIFTASHWLATAVPQSPMAGISRMATGNIEDIWNGHYLSLILSMFPHGDVLHILFNMMWLWRLGVAIEGEVNPLTYLAIIIASALISALSEIIVSGQVGIGMSGVVYAMFGLIYAGKGHNKTWRQQATLDNLKLFLGWGVLCIVLTAIGQLNVANGAHFGGLLFGYCIGRVFFAPRKNMAFAALAVAQVCLCLMVTRYEPWNMHWQWYAGNKEMKLHHYESAANHYRIGLKLMSRSSGLLQNLQVADTLLLDKQEAAHNSAEVDRLNAELKDIKQRLPEALKHGDDSVPDTEDKKGSQDSSGDTEAAHGDSGDGNKSGK
jgi:membrane associated rhomboid family serine protease